jgi:hypothetical protein
MHGVKNCEYRDRPCCRADSCGVLRIVAADVVRRRVAGRKHGATVAEVMRRRRRARDGAIVAI